MIHWIENKILFMGESCLVYVLLTVPVKSVIPVFSDRDILRKRFPRFHKEEWARAKVGPPDNKFF